MADSLRLAPHELLTVLDFAADEASARAARFLELPPDDDGSLRRAGLASLYLRGLVQIENGDAQLLDPLPLILGSVMAAQEWVIIGVVGAGDVAAGALVGGEFGAISITVQELGIMEFMPLMAGADLMSIGIEEASGRFAALPGGERGVTIRTWQNGASRTTTMRVAEGGVWEIAHDPVQRDGLLSVDVVDEANALAAFEDYVRAVA